jgi:hypothetical protein
MGCTRIDEDLLAVVEERASEELAAHVAECDACRDAKHMAVRASAVVARAGDDWRPAPELVTAIEAREASAVKRAGRVPPETSAALAPATRRPDARRERAQRIRHALLGAVVVAGLCAGLGAVKMVADGRGSQRAIAGRAWHGTVSKVVRAGADSEGGLRTRQGEGLEVPLAEGQEVKAGWHLITDPRTRARIELDDGSVIGLDRATDLLIDAAPRTAKLEEGSLVAEIAHVEGAPDARLHAPIGSVDVLGTKLVLTATSEHTSVEVLRGVIAVNDGAGGRERVSAGQEAVLSRGAPIDVAPARDLAQRVAFDGELGGAVGHGEDAGDAIRGLGELRARKPGSTAEKDRAVRLSSHAVTIRVAGNVARTEVDEVFTNDTDDVLEGIYRFPLPTGAQIERLALEVDGKLVEGEFVDKTNAAAIWRGAIHQAAPHAPKPREEIIWVPGPWRDPALLEWERGGRFELRIFPIPKRGSRRVVIAYTETVAPVGGVRRYTYPLPHWTSSRGKIDAFSIDAQVLGADPERPVRARGYELTRAVQAKDGNGSTARFSQTMTGFVPSGDLSIEYALADRANDASVFAFADPRAGGEDAFVAVALRPKLPKWVDVKPRDQVLAIDTGRAMFGERLKRAHRLAVQIVQEMDRRDRLTVLACDVACRALPGGWLTPGSGAAHDVEAFLAGSTPDGATDLVGAVRAASGVNGRDPARDLRVVLISSGVASAGYQRLERVAAEIGDALPDARAQIVTVPVGQDADAAFLREIARGGGGVVVPYQPGERVEAAALDVLNATYGATLRDVELILPSGLHDAAPRALAPIRAGEERIVVARASGDTQGDIVLKGKVAGETFVATYPIVVRVARDSGNAFVPRLYAQEKIADRERESGDAARSELVALSRRHAVPSRFTSLLVLESEAMFRAFGIDRAARGATWTGDELGTSTNVGTLAPGDGVRDGESDAMKDLLFDHTSGASPPRPARAAPSLRRPSSMPAASDSTLPAPAMSAAPELREGGHGAPPSWPRERGGRFMKRVWLRRASITSGGALAVTSDRVSAARAALAAAPDERERLKDLARLLAENGELDELDDVLVKWATRDPLDADGIASRADLLARRGDRESALRVLGGALASRSLPAKDGGLLASVLAAAHERTGDAEACAFRVAAAELRPADSEAIARAMRCERARGRTGAADRWLEGRDAAGRAAVSAAAAKVELGEAKAERAASGDIVVNASWNADADADMDISIVEPNGMRAAWCGRAGGVHVSDATSTAREALALTSSSTGPFVIELVRGHGGSRSVTGSLVVRALGVAQTFPFTLPAGAARVQVARVDVRMDAELVPVEADHLTDDAFVRGAPPFDASAANNALAVAARRAAACSQENGPIGSGTARVVFAPSGAVTRVELEPRFEGTPTGSCLARTLRAVRVAPFSGGNVTVARTFRLYEYTY